jgi:dihydrofolate reductase
MIKMIVAVSRNGVIGWGNDLPWGRGLPEDLKTFKALTMGSTLYVGKKTASNLPPLKGRDVITLGREGYPSLDTIKQRHSSGDAWIIGGAAIYDAALKLGVVDTVYLSLVDKDYVGDTFFSYTQFKAPQWKLVNETVIREADPTVKLQEWLKVGV